MIEIERKIAPPIELDKLFGDVARAAFALEGVRECDVFVRLTDDAGIRAINRDTRGIDAPTDVLSFPAASYPAGTARDNPGRIRRLIDPETGRPHLGDVIISLERAESQAGEYGHGVDRELGFLFAHAVLHLMGYDHEDEAARRAMRRMEDDIMDEVKLNREGGGRAASDEDMYLMAVRAMENAYVPYSNFKVGACALASDGQVFLGCNIENSSYGATVCAERTAIFKGVSEGARKFSAIAIAVERGAAWPCGICRQVLNEFKDGDMRIIIGQDGGGYSVHSLSELLPNAFGPDSLT